MKKYAALLLLFISTCALPNILMASEKNSHTLTAQEFRQMETRVNEIKKMDFNTLQKSDKVILKKELKEMKAKIQNYSPGGIYLSTGALLVILILLIIFL